MLKIGPSLLRQHQQIQQQLQDAEVEWQDLIEYAEQFAAAGFKMLVTPYDEEDQPTDESLGLEALRKQSQLCAAFTNCAVDFDEFMEYVTACEDQGLQIIIMPLEKATAVTKPKKTASSQKPTKVKKAQEKYWREVRAIQNELDCDIKEARKEHARRQQTIKMGGTVAKKSASNGSKKKGRGAGSANYWEEIRKIQSDQDCTTEEAREIYRKRKAS